MKTRMVRLEFGINCLADIRLLYHAWDRLWTLEGGVSTLPIRLLPHPALRLLSSRALSSR
jgi:hypothetical protein